MFDVFGSVKGLLKLESVCIDNNICRLHYKATVIILVTFSLLVTSQQYIGDPIDCIVETDSKIPQKVMDTYCWIHSTFTVEKPLNDKSSIHPGVGTYNPDKDKVKYHKYYQWVCFVLFFQAILFYVPRYLWKTWEAGRIKSLALELKSPLISDDCKNDRKKTLVEYFIRNAHNHNFYAYRFFICEVLNFVNVVGQIYFLDCFLDGEFTSYGSDVLKISQMDPENRTDPMSRVFPKMTKCTFHSFGYSGTKQIIDSLCILPLNIVNEKIYIFLWFWFVILSTLTGISLIYRILVVTLPNFRLNLLTIRSRFVPRGQLKTVMKECKIGDWFVLYQLGKNIDPMIYKEIIESLSNYYGDGVKIPV